MASALRRARILEDSRDPLATPHTSCLWLMVCALFTSERTVCAVCALSAMAPLCELHVHSSQRGVTRDRWTYFVWSRSRDPCGYNFAFRARFRCATASASAEPADTCQSVPSPHGSKRGQVFSSFVISILVGSMASSAKREGAEVETPKSSSPKLAPASCCGLNESAVCVWGARGNDNEFCQVWAC